MSKFELADYRDSGWPFPLMSVNEITLINCPNLVLPAYFKARDTISIKEGCIQVTIVFDGAILVTVTGARFRHTVAEQMIGKSFGHALDISQLRDHPVSKMTIDTIDVLEDGLDIELAA